MTWQIFKSTTFKQCNCRPTTVVLAMLDTALDQFNCNCDQCSENAISEGGLAEYGHNVCANQTVSELGSGRQDDKRAPWLIAAPDGIITSPISGRIFGTIPRMAIPVASRMGFSPQCASSSARSFSCQPSLTRSST